MSRQKLEGIEALLAKGEKLAAYKRKFIESIRGLNARFAFLDDEQVNSLILGNHQSALI